MNDKDISFENLLQKS